MKITQYSFLTLQVFNAICPHSVEISALEDTIHRSLVKNVSGAGGRGTKPVAIAEKLKETWKPRHIRAIISRKATLVQRRVNRQLVNPAPWTNHRSLFFHLLTYKKESVMTALPTL